MNFSYRKEYEMMILEVNNIFKSFGAKQALNGVSFHMGKGEIVALLGPSGCGKSTLLSIIAGFEKSDVGEIRWGGKSIEQVPTHQRGFGLMFQDFALFPHKNVAENISFGLQMLKWTRPDIERRVTNVLDLVGLCDYRDRDVTTLSGGEQQRVALARSLAPGPKFLMLDEPLGSLDRILRENLLTDIRKTLRKLKQTVLYVTHDQEEAFAIANRVVVMDAGQVLQINEPEILYRHPESPRVAHFLGLTNLLPGVIQIDQLGWKLKTILGEHPYQGEKRGPVTVLLRSDSVYPGSEGPATIRGQVIDQTFRGGFLRLDIVIQDIELTFDFSSHFSIPAIGEDILLSYDPDEAVQIF
ncbi:MAG: ABC transporter ATP-binding protein [Anaerolineae bacterium]|nr:ABC transporter ATP-binding protein [Anaerolineae bacterium]